MPNRVVEGYPKGCHCAMLTSCMGIMETRLYQLIRHINKAIDGIVLAIIYQLFHIYGRERCLSQEAPSMYRILVVPRAIITPTPTPTPEEHDDTELTSNGQWKEPQANSHNDKKDAVAPPKLPKSSVSDADASANYADDMFIEVRTADMEKLKEWSALAPADSMLESHPNAMIVTLRRDAAANAITGIGDDLTYQSVCDYLRELQAIMDRRRHDVSNPGRIEFGESEWVSEDTVWPPQNLRILDEGYHQDALTLHDTTKHLFDPTFALPLFMRPKKIVCKEQAQQVITTCFLMAALYCGMQLVV